MSLKSRLKIKRKTLELEIALLKAIKEHEEKFHSGPKIFIKDSIEESEKSDVKYNIKILFCNDNVEIICPNQNCSVFKEIRSAHLDNKKIKVEINDFIKFNVFVYDMSFDIYGKQRDCVIHVG